MRALRDRLQRRDLQPRRTPRTAGWRGHSDTETLLEAIAAWGLVEALEASVGMFALALWDRQAVSLALARDRMGEKPLYYGWQGGAFLFGSELKALRAHPAFAANPDWGAASALLELGYIPAPASIYEGIQKLPAGHVLTLQPQHVTRRVLPTSTAYWSLAGAALAAEQSPFGGSYAEAVDTL
jgi:asparagine synthase (glutamine-hydrolysing)